MKLTNCKSNCVLRCLVVLAVGALLGGSAPLVIPSATAQAELEAVDSPTNNAAAAPEATNSAQPPEETLQIHVNPSDRVNVGASTKVGKNEAVKDLLTFFGSSEVEGVVEHDMVTVFKGATLTGKVGHDMVTIFGPADVNGAVDHDVVVLFGPLKLGPKAKVGHDCVAVFGAIDRDPKAVLEREPVQVMPWLSGVTDYIRTGPLMGRPLPPGSGLAWIVVGLHFLIYLLIAAILPKPVAAVVQKFESKPLLSFGVGILVMVLLLPLYLILVSTVIGLVLVPFIGLAETAFVLLGKTAGMECWGLQIQRRIRPEGDNRPVAGFLIGFAVVTLLYMVPILGLLVWLAFRPLALGAAVISVFDSLKKNGNGGLPPSPGIPVYTAPPAPAAAAMPEPPIAVPGATPAPAPGADAGEATQPPAATASVPPKAQPGVLTGAEVAVMPRAGFWIRLAATGLDLVLLVWIIPMVHSFFPFFLIAYHVAMWTWRGTTIGGIVCKLKVVRIDGRAVDFAVALVRGLASVFSAVPLFLGFFWVGWTSERRSWHDLIAGTVIVKVPKAISLI